MDSLPRRRQSFRRVGAYRELAGDTVRNANKSKMLYSAMVRGGERDSKSVYRTESPLKFN